MTRKSILGMPALVVALLMPLAAQGAEPEAVVSGTGYVTIEKPADTMRLQVQLSVEGDSLKDALAKINAQRDEVKAGLVKLGAAEKSFNAGDVGVSDGSAPTDRQSALSRAMRERMAGRGGPATAAAAKVTATCLIKVDWTLKGDGPGGLLVAAQELKDKIKNSKLLDAPKTPAQAELAEEAAAMAAMMESGPSATEPIFIFVATVSDAEQAKAMSEAFAKAKDSAARLAKAAGSELGGLKALDGQTSADMEDAYALQEYAGSAVYRQLVMQNRGMTGGDVKEGVSMQPGKVSLQVVVRASFAIK